MRAELELGRCLMVLFSCILFIQDQMLSAVTSVHIYRMWSLMCDQSKGSSRYGNPRKLMLFIWTMNTIKKLIHVQMNRIRETFQSRLCLFGAASELDTERRSKRW